MSEHVRAYPKIDTIFERHEDFTVDPARIRRPEFLLPKHWMVTEKIDGTNVRVSLESYIDEDDARMIVNPTTQWKVVFYGRTSKAQMPTFLLEYLQKTFTLEKLQRLWRGKSGCDICHGSGNKNADAIHALMNATLYVRCECIEPYPVVLYGGGYGARIQKGGGDYRSDVSFQLFDVLVGNWWLSRENVEDVAAKLRIKAVPLIDGKVTLEDIIYGVSTGMHSIVAKEEGTPRLMEGVVLFTNPPLFNTKGDRLIAKLKTADFGKEK